MAADDQLRLRLAARAMGRHGLAHAYGHVSLRQGGDSLLVGPPLPLLTVPNGASGDRVALSGPFPEGILPEVRIHRAVYRQRPDVGGICRVQPPALMALSALGRTPRVLHGLGTYFAPQPPLWDRTALVRDDAAAAELAECLGQARAIVLRGNGLVAVGETIEQAAAHAWFLEDAARLELSLLPAAPLTGGDGARVYSSDEAAARAIAAGGLYERMWQFLCFGDPEWSAAEMKQ